ncbi:hypothetical protein T484DRAFT_1864937 [Baffinella frigidus]|nr:hypothetical protein T484DRAFT_1864937 [Cryptophyta sp. CCMP2293]
MTRVCAELNQLLSVADSHPVGCQVEFPQQHEPPYIGYGTEEDSIASFYRLVPKPRTFDALKQEELDKIVFRWKAKFDVRQMSQVFWV